MQVGLNEEELVKLIQYVNWDMVEEAKRLDAEGFDWLGECAKKGVVSATWAPLFKKLYDARTEEMKKMK